MRNSIGEPRIVVYLTKHGQRRAAIVPAAIAAELERPGRDSYGAW
jgi:hypothetical protein